MEIIKPSVEILEEIYPLEMLKRMEFAGRISHKSEEKITTDSYKKFIPKLMKMGHMTILEHEKISVLVICDRGVTHEIVRHRLSSYTQESTRYCNYSSEDIKFIEPCFFDGTFEGHGEDYGIWLECMIECEEAYNRLIELGSSPQEARSVLPNSLKTEIVITNNLRQWRYFLKMRCNKSAHPQMREIAMMILRKFKSIIPIIFDDFIDRGNNAELGGKDER